jgi:hypothetical protein
LLRGIFLEEAGHWLQQRGMDFAEEERAFVRASLRIPEQRRRWKRGFLGLLP